MLPLKKKIQCTEVGYSYSLCNLLCVFMGFAVESTLKLGTTVSFYIFTNSSQNIILPLDVDGKTQLKTKDEYPRKVPIHCRISCSQKYIPKTVSFRPPSPKWLLSKHSQTKILYAFLFPHNYYRNEEFQSHSSIIALKISIPVTAQREVTYLTTLSVLTVSMVHD